MKFFKRRKGAADEGAEAPASDGTATGETLAEPPPNRTPEAPAEPAPDPAAPPPAVGETARPGFFTRLRRGLGRTGDNLVAGLGSDSIRGVENSTSGYTYSFSGLSSASAAAVSLAAMDGIDGGFAVLAGSTPLTSTSITLWADEDTLGDTERKHTTEQAGYLILE